MTDNPALIDDVETAVSDDSEPSSPAATEAKCPFAHGGSRPRTTQTNRDWWSNQLDVQVLHRQSAKSNPMGGAFD
jgi:catalase-peroxidase